MHRYGPRVTGVHSVLNVKSPRGVRHGFIKPDEGGKDVFVHIRAVERAGLRGLVEGQKVSCEVQADRRAGKESTANLRAA